MLCVPRCYDHSAFVGVVFVTFAYARGCFISVCINFPYFYSMNMKSRTLSSSDFHSIVMVNERWARLLMEILSRPGKFLFLRDGIKMLKAD